MIASQRTGAVVVAHALYTGSRLSVADVACRASRAIRKATRRTAVLEAGFATIAGIVITTARHALIIFAASIVTTTRIIAAAFLA